MRTITLKTKPSFKQKYQLLLRKDWSMSGLRAVLKLLDELLQTSHAVLRFSWEESEHEFRGSKRTIDSEDLSQLLATHLPLRLPGIPVMPDMLGRLLEIPNDEVTLAVRAWVYLDLQALFELRGETDFLRDLQSILFLNVIESLLPELRARGMSELHSILIHALGYHNAVVWRDNPAHQQYLLAAWAHYLGDRNLEADALHSAFRLSGPDEHDYLTLAQSYWQFLMEDRRFEDAERFLLGVYREAPREQLDEIKGLIDDTYAGRDVAHA